MYHKYLNKIYYDKKYKDTFIVTGDSQFLEDVEIEILSGSKNPGCIVTTIEHIDSWCVEINPKIAKILYG